MLLKMSIFSEAFVIILKIETKILVSKVLPDSLTMKFVICLHKRNIFPS